MQGELIADSGTMSGGGRPQTGRMALGNSAPRGAATDARAAEAELREIDKQADQLNQVHASKTQPVKEMQDALSPSAVLHLVLSGRHV